MSSRSKIVRLRNWQPPLDGEQLDKLLSEGEIDGGELVPWGSNYTYYVDVRADGIGCQAVYKPRRGEAPLMDFPSGTLYLREQAAYLVSEWLGWNLVPHTVIRNDAPYGPGTLQIYVEADGPPHVYSLTRENLSDLERMVLFDIIVNNADRKPAHCFKGIGHGLWAIDHGLTFHARPKMRTVVWDFCGEPISTPLLSSLREARKDAARVADLNKRLAPLLARREIEAYWQRVDDVLERGVFPRLDPRYNIPYGFA